MNKNDTNVHLDTPTIGLRPINRDKPQPTKLEKVLAMMSRISHHLILQLLTINKTI